MRAYKTSRWLWLLMSVAVFVGIGFVPWFDMKGGNALFGVSVLEPLYWVVTGQVPFGWALLLMPRLIGWMLVSAALGWCMQSLFTIVFSTHEKPKDPA